MHRYREGKTALIKFLSDRAMLLLAGAGLVLLTSCDTREARKTTVPSAQALAPSIQQQPVSTPAPAPPVAQTKPPEPPKPDPVVTLIADAEKAYQTGVADYNAGHLDAAKQDFNRAVDILMQGPVDVKSD